MKSSWIFCHGVDCSISFSLTEVILWIRSDFMISFITQLTFKPALTDLEISLIHFFFLHENPSLCCLRNFFFQGFNFNYILLNIVHEWEKQSITWEIGERLDDTSNSVNESNQWTGNIIRWFPLSAFNFMVRRLRLWPASLALYVLFLSVGLICSLKCSLSSDKWRSQMVARFGPE